MEDIKLILYILAAVAVFLYNIWRKAFSNSGEDQHLPDELPKRKPASQAQPQPPKPLPSQQPRQQVPQRPTAPPTSFEDILRELQPKVERAKEQARPVVERPTERAKEIIREEPKYQPARSYEQAAATALSLEDPEEAREARRRAQRRQIATHETFAAYKTTEKLANKYAVLLRNPQTVRDAFVLSEIFQRKYQ